MQLTSERIEEIKAILRERFGSPGGAGDSAAPTARLIAEQLDVYEAALNLQRIELDKGNITASANIYGSLSKVENDLRKLSANELADEVKRCLKPLLDRELMNAMCAAVTEGSNDPFRNFKSTARLAWNGYLKVALADNPEPEALSAAERHLRQEVGQLAGADGTSCDLYKTIVSATTGRGTGRAVGG